MYYLTEEGRKRGEGWRKGSEEDGGSWSGGKEVKDEA